MTESGFKVEEKGRGWGEREVGGEDERRAMEVDGS